MGPTYTEENARVIDVICPDANFGMVGIGEGLSAYEVNHQKHINLPSASVTAYIIKD